VKECPPELFFSLPNVETFLPLFIDGDQLRGIFCIIDIDRYVRAGCSIDTTRSYGERFYAIAGLR
jgi:hypothetical protein